MSLFNLAIHSLSIIAVFKNIVLLRSSIMFIALFLMMNFLGATSFLLQTLLLIFNLIIFLVSLRENENELLNSHKNILSEDHF